MMSHAVSVPTMTTLTLDAWNSDHEGVDPSIEVPEAVAAVFRKLGADLRVLKGSDGAAKPPVYEAHKRGKNWMAKLVGKNAANMDRVFTNYRNGLFDFQAVEPFTAVEFGADYYTGSGTPHRNREYGVMVESHRDDRWVFASMSSVASAMKLARALAAIPKPEPVVATVEPVEAGGVEIEATAETAEETPTMVVLLSERQRQLLSTALQMACDAADAGNVYKASGDDFRDLARALVAA